jgi:hypothetical protein
MRVPPGQDVNAPLAWSLQPPYPNPFNPATVLEFTVPTTSDGTIAAYDLLGRRVGTVDVGPWSIGSHRIIWNAGSLPSGAYFLRLEAPGIQKVQKVILLK